MRGVFDMATNWNAVLANINNASDILAILRKVLGLLDGKVDLTKIDEIITDISNMQTNVDTALTNVSSALSEFDLESQEAIQQVIAAGLMEGFATEAELLATRPTVPKKYAKAEDTDVIWFWNKPEGSPDGNYWISTGLSEYNRAINYVDANGLFKAIPILSTNLTPAEQYTTKGWYLVGSATTATNMGLPSPSAGFFHVIDNGGGTVLQKWYPYNSSLMYLRSSNTNAVFPPWQKLVTEALFNSLLNAVLVNYINKENIDAYIAKPYDIVSDSKNLYDESKAQLGKFISSGNGNILEAAGWACSDFIPVVPGEYVTISSIARRVGAATYESKETSGTTNLGYISSPANPLTIQIPEGANFLVVNIDSTAIHGVNVQVERGQVATGYEPGGKQYKIDASYIAMQSSKSSLQIFGDNAVLSGRVDGLPISLNFLLRKTTTHSQSTVFNFASDVVNNVLQRTLTDDIAPMRIDGYVIGANHGYQKSNLTLVGHGKTVSDLGSVWTSGGKEWVIVDIVSANVLSITARADNSIFTVAELVHVSGATNTASFTPTSKVDGQWYPTIRDHKLTCFVDDVQIDLNQPAIYDFNRNVKIFESYSLMKKTDIVEWLILNKGVNHVNYGAVPCYTVNFGYTFDHECGCTIYFGGVGRKTVALQDQMITQSIQLSASNGTVYNYIPKSLPFSHAGYNYDFAMMEDIRSKNPPQDNPIYINQDRQEAGNNPIDRLVMLNDQVGYATGYLPVLDAAPDIRSIKASRKYLEIRDVSLKVYPRLIDTASITSINENDTFAAIAYRKYFKRSSERTCKYVVRSEPGDFLYLDWHTSKTDEIELPADLVGRDFSIHEKSSNVSVLSPFASNNLLVKIDNSKNYGFLVLRFK